MSCETVRFVGGPMDGQVFALPAAALNDVYVCATPDPDRPPWRAVDPVVAVEPYGFVRHEYQLVRLFDGGWAYVHPDARMRGRSRVRLSDMPGYVGAPRSRPPAVNPQGWHACAACEVRWTGGRHCWSCGEEGDPVAAPLVGEHGY